MLNSIALYSLPQTIMNGALRSLPERVFGHLPGLSMRKVIGWISWRAPGDSVSGAENGLKIID